MSVIETRLANVDDVSRISLIMMAVWPRAEPNRVRIGQILRDNSHVTLVATVDARVAGFVDGFATTTVDGIVRWEVDLLAVHPDFQRQGIGSHLVEANTEAGQKSGAHFARGLVAVDNVGSQKAFSRCGYETDGSTHELLVLDRPQTSTNMYKESGVTHLIPVKTINYTGLWIEGQRQESDLLTAIHKLIESGDDLAGIVVPKNEITIIQNAIRLGFENMGRYQWWLRPLDAAS